MANQKTTSAAYLEAETGLRQIFTDGKFTLTAGGGQKYEFELSKVLHAINPDHDVFEKDGNRARANVVGFFQKLPEFVKFLDKNRLDTKMIMDDIEYRLETFNNQNTLFLVSNNFGYVTENIAKFDEKKFRDPSTPEHIENILEKAGKAGLNVESLKKTFSESLKSRITTHDYLISYNGVLNSVSEAVDGVSKARESATKLGILEASFNKFAQDQIEFSVDFNKYAHSLKKQFKSIATCEKEYLPLFQKAEEAGLDISELRKTFSSLATPQNSTTSEGLSFESNFQNYIDETLPEAKNVIEHTIAIIEAARSRNVDEEQIQGFAKKVSEKLGTKYASNLTNIATQLGAQGFDTVNDVTRIAQRGFEKK